MKFVSAALVVLPVVAAFCPSQLSRPAFGTQLASSVVTGPGGKAAASAEEDLMLTLRIIMDHQERSTTVSKEQYIQQVEAAKVEAAKEDPPVVVDISVPYDAAAKLAYEASDKSMAYDAFKVKYEAEAVELVKSKRPQPAVDISVPYDAAAKLAYEASDKSMAYPEFKVKYEAEAVELVKSKRPQPAAEISVAKPAVDISVPYDAAAKLAYEASDKSMPYPEFKVKYEADAVALVKSKQPVDISVPYDAPARLAFAASDRSVPYAEFKAKYEADAVAEVISKKK